MVGITRSRVIKDILSNFKPTVFGNYCFLVGTLQETGNPPGYYLLNKSLCKLRHSNSNQLQ